MTLVIYGNSNNTIVTARDFESVKSNWPREQQLKWETMYTQNLHYFEKFAFREFLFPPVNFWHWPGEIKLIFAVW